MSRLPCLALAILIWLSAGMHSNGFAAADVSFQQRTVVYKTVGDVELLLHVFEPPAHGAQQSRPAIVFFFGGGWVGGTPRQFFEHCQHLASRGMVAMSAEYRVKSRHQTTPFECVEDGKSAVRWIRAHATELGIDPKRIAAGGGSAGGHVAASTAVISGHEAKGEDLSISSKPNALVLFNPVIDTTKAGYGAGKVKGRETEISPAHHVVEGLPPTLILHGEADKTVPLENVERFCRLMKAAGNSCRVVAYEGQGHGFFNRGRSPGMFEKTVQAMDEFLAEQGYLGSTDK